MTNTDTYTNHMVDIGHYVIGSGAIGLSITAMLCRISIPRLISRSHTTNQFCILDNGIRSKYSAPEQFFSESWDSISHSNSPRYFWVTVKSYDLNEVCTLLAPILSATDCVILCENGFNIREQAATILGSKSPLIRALLNFGALKKDNEVVEQFGSIRILLASMPKHIKVRNSVNDLLSRAGVEVKVAPDIPTAEWEKATINLVVNSLCTLANLTNAELLSNSKLVNRAQRLLSEIDQVASALGIGLINTHWEKFTAIVTTFGNNRNSALIDLERGRKTEIEPMLAHFIAQASQVKIDVPESKLILDEIRSHYNSAVVRIRNNSKS